MSTNAELAQLAAALEENAGMSTEANLNRSGYMRRIALALETLTGTSTSANANQSGYLQRAAEAADLLSLGGGGPVGVDELTPAAFSGVLQIGVAASGTILSTDDKSIISTSVPGITINNSVFPQTYSGTPTEFGTFTITETNPAASNSPLTTPVAVLEGAPVFTVNPAITGTFQVGQTVTGSSGTAPGATSFAYKWFRRSGGTGSGTAIATGEGGDLASRPIPEADLNLQYSLRVRAYRGSLYAEYTTPWSATIVAASSTLPAFSGASSYTTTGNAVGDMITVTPGAGTGQTEVEYLLEGQPIPDASGLTYVLKWGDRLKKVVPRVKRKGTDGLTVVDTAPLAEITVVPKLSARYHGNPSWFDGSTLRWMPPILVTPYEPGKTMNGVTPIKVQDTFAGRDRTLDHRWDLYFKGNEHWLNPGTPMPNAFKCGGGRNGVYANFETTGRRWQHTKANGRISFYGIKSTNPNAYDDVLFYGGAESNTNGGFQRTDIQGCYLPTIGWYANPFVATTGTIPTDAASGFNQVPIKSIERISSSQVKILLDISSPPSYTTGGTTYNWRPPVSKVVESDGSVTYKSYIIAYNVQKGGVVNPLNADWNTNYYVDSYNPTTGEVIGNIRLNSSEFGGAINEKSTLNTGMAVCFANTADFHSDGAQKGKGIAGRTRRHANTYWGNYTAWGVDGLNPNDSDNEMIHSCENIRRRLDFNPQEFRAQLILWGSVTQGTQFYHEATNIYIENTWIAAGPLQLVGPSDGGETTVDGLPYVMYGSSKQPNAIGGVYVGAPPPGGDFAPPARDMWNWVPTFHGQRNPTNADFTGVTYDVIKESTGAKAGDTLGQLMLGHNLPEGLADAAGRVIIVDFVITGTDAGKVTQDWSGVLKATTDINAPLSIQVEAVVRDSVTRYGSKVGVGPVPIAFGATPPPATATIVSTTTTPPATIGTSGTTFTFNVSTGTGVREVLVPVIAFAGALRTFSSATANGKAATQVPGSYAYSAAGSNHSITALYRVALGVGDPDVVPIVVTTSGTTIGCSIGVEVVTGLGALRDLEVMTALQYAAPTPVTVDVAPKDLVIAWGGYASAATSGNRKATYAKQIIAAGTSLSVAPSFTGPDLNFGGAFTEVMDQQVGSNGGTPPTCGGVAVFAPAAL